MTEEADRHRKQRIEETTEIVVGVLDAYRRKDSEAKGPVASVFQRLTKNWVVFLFAVSLVGTFIGWAVYGISPLQPLEEIAARQNDYKRKELHIQYRNRMVQRHIDLGNTFLNVAQLDAARSEFESALKLDPDNSDAHFGKLKAEIFAPIANKEYDTEIAKSKLDLVLRERPDDPHVLAYLGDIYRKISTKQALDYYQKAIARDPSIAAAYQGIGVIYDMDNKMPDAIKMYEKALALSSWNQTYLNNLGYQYLRLNDYPKAIEKYRLLLQLDSRYLLTYYTLSNAYRLTGNLPDALWVQELLLDLLNDEKITSLPQNKGEWFFHTDSRRVHFYDLPMRACYAYYNAALTAFLNKDTAKAEEYVAKAKGTRTANEWLVKTLVKYDVKLLKSKENQYSKPADAFAAKYL